MQWLYAVQSHLLGFIERTHGRADAKQLAAVVESQKRELIQIEKYYTRAAEKAARIVYFWGMMVTRLRKLHSRGDPGSASFKRTLRMLREHTATRDNASATWFRHVLQGHQTAIEEINRTSLIGLVREQVDSEGNVVSTEQVSPAETFWDWVYGVYLHDAEDKLARVESWRPISLHKFNFLQMATDLSRLYYSFSGIVREVLAVPTLVPRAFSEGS